MSETMPRGIEPQDVATDLGLASPTQAQLAQWQSWIDRAYRMIHARAARQGVTLADAVAVDDVVLWAVVRRASRPVDGVESTTDQIGVDDGSWNQTRRYAAGQGDLFFLDSWWDHLGLSASGRKAFTIRLGGYR